MPRFVIEREIPGAGTLSAEELQGISAKSCTVLNELGPQIQWVHSYVTGDKVYCVYIAPNEEMVREHARRGEFPANVVSQVTSMTRLLRKRDCSANASEGHVGKMVRSSRHRGAFTVPVPALIALVLLTLWVCARS